MMCFGGKQDGKSREAEGGARTGGGEKGGGE